MFNELKKSLLLVLGTLSLGLGIVGILLPVLPTTPFLLLAAFCYLRSSSRLYAWLINHRLFGPYIYNYLTYRAIERKVKYWTIGFLWITLGISIYLLDSFYLRLFLCIVGLGVSIHVLSLKDLDKVTQQKEKGELPSP